MKDLFEELEASERKFFGIGNERSGLVRCHFCREEFHEEDTERVGEQLIRGKYYRNARACISCAPLEDE